jgi:hypothetical protein
MAVAFVVAQMHWWAVLLRQMPSMVVRAALVVSLYRILASRRCALGRVALLRKIIGACHRCPILDYLLSTMRTMLVSL